MYEASRFLYDNVLASGTVTVSSQKTGAVGGAQKTAGGDAIGTAIMYASGDYSGTENLDYTIQVYNVLGGKSIGQAKVRWRTSATSPGAWEATDILTTTNNVTMSNGVTFRFVSAGTGNDFEGLDTWTVRAYATWSPSRLSDGLKGTTFKTGNLSTLTVTVDCGAAQDVSALAIVTHNLTSSATVTLYADSDSGFSPADQTLGPYAMTADTPYVLYFATLAYRYWRVAIADATNPDGYMEIDTLFLGDYTELDGNAEWGSQEEHDVFAFENQTPVGVYRESVANSIRRLTLNYPVITSTEFDSIQACYDAVRFLGSGVSKGFLFHLFSDVPSSIRLVRFASSLSRTYRRKGLDSITLSLEELV
jgi:hypothetical protein